MGVSFVLREIYRGYILYLEKFHMVPNLYLEKFTRAKMGGNSNINTQITCEYKGINACTSLSYAPGRGW